MPLARIRTHSRESALELAEELYGLGYTVETIAPSEYRAAPADLEIELEACTPAELVPLVATCDFEHVFMAEGVVDVIPLPATVASYPVLEQSQEEPIAIAHLQFPADEGSAATTLRQRRPAVPMQQLAELVAAIGTRVGDLGLRLSDFVDDTRMRITALKKQVQDSQRGRSERAKAERARKLSEASSKNTEPAVLPVAAPQQNPTAVSPIAAEAHQPIFEVPQPALREEVLVPSAQQERSVPEVKHRPRPATPIRSSRRRNPTLPRKRTLRASPTAALKIGTAVGLFGMMMLIGYANRRPATPVGLGELTRSTTVVQAAPFGSAEAKPVSQSIGAAGDSSLGAPGTNSNLEKPPAPKVKVLKSVKVRPGDNDEPEVVVRHYTPQPNTRAANAAKGDGVKRFSDLD